MTTSADNSELERAIRKIKHCLALSKSSNEHEAAAAMRQAKKLMDKYRLSETDIHLSDVGRADAAAAKARLKPWEVSLACAVAEAFNCKTVIHTTYTDAGLRRKLIYFVGVSPAQDIACYAYESLHSKVTYDRRQYIRHIKQQKLSSRHTSATRGDHFADSWAQAVWSKLEALKPSPDMQSDETESKALVAVAARENELVDAYLKKDGVKDGRKARDLDIDPYDAMNGHRKGREAELNHGVGNTGDVSLSIGLEAA